MIKDSFFINIRSLLTFSLAIIYLSNLFIQSKWLSHLTFILLILVILMVLPVVTGSSKIIGYISFGISIFLFIYYKAPFSVWEKAIEGNLYLVTMFTLVPLLRIPIQNGGYAKPLKEIFRRFVNTRGRFYLLVSLISAFVGILVNLAVVPLVHEISKASDYSANKRLLSAAISRGFTTSTIWSPTMASIAMILQLTGAEGHLFFPLGILCGFLCGFTGYILTMIEGRKTKLESNSSLEQGDNSNYLKVVELSIFGFILISVIAGISFGFGIHTITVVSLVSLVFPVIWLKLIGRLPVLFREFKGEYFHRVLPSLKNEIILFIGAGLLASSITYSHLGDYVPNFLSMLVGDNIILFTMIIIFTSLLLSAVGVHPIVTISIIGETVKATAYGITPTYMALVLAVSWAMGISISPSAANIIAVASLAEQSPIQIGLRWNGPYVLVSSLILILLLTILRAIQII